MIQVVEAKEVERRTMRVHCEFCGANGTMELIRMTADGEETTRLNLPICCKATADAMNQGSTGNN
jgi:hypothetical protein